MRSLRTRLSRQTAIATTILLLAGGVLLYYFQRAALVADLDRLLDEQARLFVSAVDLEFGEVEFEFDDLDMRDFEEPGGPGYLQVFVADGGPKFSSESMGRGLLLPLPGPIEYGEKFWQEVPTGDSVRATILLFAPGEPLPADQRLWNEGLCWLAIARTTDDMDRTLRNLKLLLLVIGPITVLLIIAELHLVVGEELRPLGAVAGEIKALDADDLSARIEAAGAPSELRPVTDRLNEMLARLEEAFHRERSFSADVAHELRTPLAGIRSTAEVMLARDRTGDDYREALDDVLQVTAEMQGMVEKLLAIARLESNGSDGPPEPVVPNDVVRACWEQSAAAAHERGLTVAWDLGPDTAVTTDRRLLELAVRNVIENAVRYADESGTIELRTASAPSGAAVTVCNTGSVLSQEEASHVFDRFWRGDSARTDAAVRAGLGLSLVQRIMTTLGGTVSAESRAGGTFCVTLSVPSAPID